MRTTMFLRDAIVARRGQTGSPKALGRPDALDSALFDAGASNIPNIPQPPQ